MKLFCYFIIVVALSTKAFGAPSIVDNKIDDSDSTLGRMSKLFGQCADSDDVATCLAIKGITALNRIARSNNIEIFPGITFTRDQNSSPRIGKSISESDIVSDLSKEVENKNGRLLDLALQTVSDFFSTHSLQVKVPEETTQGIARAIDEARNKKKKFMGPLMMAVGAKLLALIPLFLGGLAFLAIKAVIVAKIAFLLAIALGASKLFGSGGLGGKLGGLGGLGGGIGGGGYNANYNGGGGGGGWNGGNAGWSSSGSGAYPYARSIDTPQDLAYSAQIPKQE